VVEVVEIQALTQQQKEELEAREVVQELVLVDLLYLEEQEILLQQIQFKEYVEDMVVLAQMVQVVAVVELLDVVVLLQMVTQEVLVELVLQQV
jgi:hypothetical protein